MSYALKKIKKTHKAVASIIAVVFFFKLKSVVPFFIFAKSNEFRKGSKPPNNQDDDAYFLLLT